MAKAIQFHMHPERKLGEGKFDANHPVFVRYGGLSSVRQKGYVAGDPPGYSTPPARRGIFAFVQWAPEPFLLGDGGEMDGRRMQWVRDRSGSIVDESHPQHETRLYRSKGDRYARRGDNWALVADHRPRKFRYGGDIWHHLADAVAPHEVVARKGNWVKTDMSAYIGALRKKMGERKSLRRRGHRQDRDPMEVFIEKV